MGTRVIADTTIGVGRENAEKYHIAEMIVPLSFEDNTVVKETELSREEFFTRLNASKKLPTTSQPPYLEVMNLFESILSAGDDIIGIFVSHYLSGIYNEACMVWNELKEKYPERKVVLLDSLQACMAGAYPAIEAAKAAEAGVPFEKIVEDTETLIRNANLLFIPVTLENLRKGGRIGKASALIGTFLDIHPLLEVTGGVVDIVKKCRGTKSAIDFMIKRVIKDREAYGMRKIIIQFGGDLVQGEKLMALAREKLGEVEGLAEISHSMSVHAGAACGIAYFTEKR